MAVATIMSAAVIGLAICIGGGQPGLDRRTTPARRECVFPGDDSSLPIVVADLPDGASSDGRGPYLTGINGVSFAGAGHEGALVFYWPDTASGAGHRFITVNLNKPVPGGKGVPLGIHSSENRSGLILQRGMIGDTIKNLLDLRVGQRESAALLSISVHVDGRKHLLQMGPQANGHCMDESDGVHKNQVHGTGTSKGTIFRASRTKWVIDLPSGSIGRLFDMQGSYDHAVDKGLYYVHLHYEIGH